MLTFKKNTYWCYHRYHRCKYRPKKIQNQANFMSEHTQHVSQSPDPKPPENNSPFTRLPVFVHHTLAKTRIRQDLLYTTRVENKRENVGEAIEIDKRRKQTVRGCRVVESRTRVHMLAIAEQPARTNHVLDYSNSYKGPLGYFAEVLRLLAAFSHIDYT